MLIAQIPTAVLVDGQRTVVQPGQPLPTLTEADQAALLASGAAAVATHPEPADRRAALAMTEEKSAAMTQEDAVIARSASDAAISQPPKKKPTTKKD